jgi:hypothetical protein
MADLLARKAKEGRKDPAPLLGISELFGPLGRDPALLEAVRFWLERIYEDGIRATLAAGAERELY